MGSGNKSGRSNIGCCDEAEETIACNVRLGLKMMQQHHMTTESSSYPVLNNLNSNSMSDNYNRNHAAPDSSSSSSSSSFLSGYFGSGDGGAFGRGRGGDRNFLCSNTHMFDAVSTPPAGGGGRAGGIASSGQRTLPAPASSSQFNSDASFKSPWGTRAFTEAQRQELERQTVIYKYMVACVPVPPELLSSSISYVRNHPDGPFNCRSSTSSFGWTGTGAVGNKSNGTVELRFASSNDPEPWRCRRTDGKKWRCSRDVAPDQKYCERHSHKGRPSRSRKPVESSLGINHHRPRPNISPVPENLVLLNSSLSAPTSSSATFVPLQFSVTNNNNNDNDNDNNNSTMFMRSQQKQNQGPPSFLNQTALISPTQCNHFRYPTPTTTSTPTTLDWFMKRTPTAVPASLPATVPVPVPAAAAAAASLYPQIQLGQFPLTQPRDDPSDFNHKYGSLFHDSRSREMGSTSTDQNCILPRQFLDTWSSLGNERDGIGQITSTSKSISSSLTLSMSGGRTDDRVSAGLGIGLFDSQRDGGGDVDGDQGMVQQDFNWMINSGSSWMTSAPPGGPLAEALCLGISSSSGRGGSGDGDGEASPMGPSSSGRTSSSGGGNGTLN